MTETFQHSYADRGDVRGGVIEECGHWIPEERPDWVVELLLIFFGAEAEDR